MAKAQVPFFYMFMMASFRTLRHSYELFKNHQSQLLALELKRLKKEIEADESEEFGGYLKQSIEREFANVFPRLQSYYAIVLLYSNVEYWLRRLSKRLREDGKLPLGHSDFQGTPVEKYTRFSKAFKKPTFRQADYGFLREVEEIRNCIVHSNGDLNALDGERKKRMLSLCRKHKGMKVDFFDGLVLSDSFCIQTVERVTEMMKTLFEANGLHRGRKS
jgi:hypothetical protein